jgi:hypothetical protein
MTIWEITQQALEALSVPVGANVMILPTGDEFPDLFLIYQLIDAPPLLHVNDHEDMRYYRMQVTIYSRDGLADLPDVISAMVEAGFTRSSIRELPYNTETRHYGLAMEFIFTSDNVTVDESY